MNDAEFNRIARLWLDEGPGEMPDRGFAAALARIERLPQRHRAALLRNTKMKLTWQLAATAAASVAIVFGALLIIGSPAPGPGRSITPAPTATPAMTAAGPTIGIGGRIAFSAFAESDFATFTTDPSDSLVARLAGPPSSHPRWAPDGSRIWVALVPWAGGGPVPLPPGTYAGTVLPDGSDLQTMVLPDGAPSWLLCTAWVPDGSRIACSGKDLDGSDGAATGIYTVRTSDGQDLVRLTTTPASFVDVPGDFSPDGRQLAFVRVGSDGDGTIWIVNADGTDERQLTTDLFDGLEGDSSDSLDWSPDGRTIVASLNGYGYLLDVASGGPSPSITRISIPKSPVGRDVLVRHPRWSPDGTEIAFVTHFGPSGPQQDDVLAIMKPDGTDLRRTTIVANSPDWWAP